MTNAPDRYERFVLPEGVSKVTRIKDTRITNAATFEVQREDHTLGNLIRMQLHRDPEVLFAGYKAPHPLEYKINFKVQARDTTNPETVFRRAIDAVDTEIADLRKAFTEELARPRDQGNFY
ncbi:DNA-directed RNA polymerase II subunit 11 [Klebsormidium nitens]|uniref:DNA-directed RNA polymerase II subunit 11 n=1 Tax=Klebsormidium nitens TaxID=105231 RepID=A0A1Y1IIP5_KLENI|nr:DNA-directed RNA polymerase II subunit 11 [Klebsormidium nitens]|eukprot:GAQ88981.1 DNA-directed RNA polymerase II subunit 11 [Klebsormidium nitens]